MEACAAAPGSGRPRRLAAAGGATRSEQLEGRGRATLGDYLLARATHECNYEAPLVIALVVRNPRVMR